MIFLPSCAPLFLFADIADAVSRLITFPELAKEPARPSRRPMSALRRTATTIIFRATPGRAVYDEAGHSHH